MQRNINVCARPHVSILTPVYNGEKYIAECIESVLAQNYQNWDYTIVNNCSTDSTGKIGARYAAGNSRIRVHTGRDFLDIIANHNPAFRLVSPESKYVKVVSADDWLFPDCLAQMVSVAEANPSAGIVGAFGISGEKVNYVGLPFPGQVFSGREVCRSVLLGGPYVLGSPTSTLYRADLIRGRKDFYANSTPHADMAACFETLRNTDIGFVHQVLVYERVHSGQMTAICRKLNTWLTVNLSFLLEYGPVYLNRREYEKRLSMYLDEYYRVLAGSLFQREKEFWRYHINELARIGQPLSRARLARALFLTMADSFLHPKETTRGVVKRFRTALSRT